MREIARGLTPAGLEARPDRDQPAAASPCDGRDRGRRPGCQRLLETSNILQAGTAAATIKRWLDERTEERLMIVGHNPSVTELVALLVHGSSSHGSATSRKAESPRSVDCLQPRTSSSSPGSQRLA